MRTALLALLIACNSRPIDHFGVVTNEGKAAFAEMCGSNLEHPQNLPPDWFAPKHWMLQCFSWEAEKDEGLLVIDATDGSLVTLGIDVHSRDVFDHVVNSLLVPTLTERANAGYQQLRASMSNPHGFEGDWPPRSGASLRKGQALISVKAQDPAAAAVLHQQPLWSVDAVVYKGPE